MKTTISLLLLTTISNCGYALADDANVDGQWRGDGGAALSVSSGNSHSSSLNLTVNAARITTENKLSLYGQILGSRSENANVSSTNANLWMAGTRYDHNITPDIFGFGGLDFSHDQIKQLSLRSGVSGGLGYHIIETPDTQWDLFGGVAYRTDKYSGSGVSINNVMKTKLNATELLLGEESTHRISEAISFKQKLVASPNICSSKGIRATFDTGLLVALNKTLSLNVTLQDRYDSLSQAPVKKNDILFFTGINVKFGG